MLKLIPPKSAPSTFSASTILVLCLVLMDSSVGKSFVRLQADLRSDLVKTSRKAIIDTGFSAAYFDQHFKLLDVIDKPGDLRVIWQFSADGYRLRITDAVGFAVAAGGKKTYLHSVGNNLGATRNIGKTISKQRAQALMRTCIGKFASDSVVLMKLDKDRTASLYLMAYSARGKSREDRDQDRNERDKSRPADAQDRPPLESGQDRPLKIGYINLETGKCSQGEATVTP